MIVIPDDEGEHWRRGQLFGIYVNRVDGTGMVVDPGPELDELLGPLHIKYRGNYGRHRPDGPAIVIDVDRWVGWSASEGV